MEYIQSIIPMEYLFPISIFIFQLLFQLSRTLGNRYIAKDHVLETIAMTAIIQALWLITTAMGVKAVFDWNWYSISSYMIGGVIGSYIAMKYTIKSK